MDAIDQRIRRAAGMIVWSVWRGATLSTATANASKRERSLTEKQLLYAQGWALATINASDLAKACWPTLTDAERKHPDAWRRAADRCIRGKTLQMILDLSEVSDYANPANMPTD